MRCFLKTALGLINRCSSEFIFPASFFDVAEILGVRILNCYLFKFLLINLRMLNFKDCQDIFLFICVF